MAFCTHSDLGDYAPGDTIDFKFTSSDNSGVPTTLAGTPAVLVYKSNSTTESSSTGITLTVDFDARTGCHHVNIATGSNSAFFTTAGQFDVVVTAGTVGGVSVVGYTVARFTTRLGAAGGIVTLGTNASAISFTAGVTISSSTGSALTCSSSGSNGNGINVSGNGTGAGLLATGGATGNGAKLVGGATSGDALLTSATSGHGATFAGTGTTKHGINATGGATTSHGINATGGGVGHGILATSGGGSTGDGIKAIAASTNGHGLEVVGVGTGAGHLCTAGATGNGLSIAGGATSGDAVTISTISGHGFKVAAAGSAKNAWKMTSTGGDCVDISSSGGHGFVISTTFQDVGFGGYYGLYCKSLVGGYAALFDSSPGATTTGGGMWIRSTGTLSGAGGGGLIVSQTGGSGGIGLQVTSSDIGFSLNGTNKGLTVTSSSGPAFDLHGGTYSIECWSPCLFQGSFSPAIELTSISANGALYCHGTSGNPGAVFSGATDGAKFIAGTGSGINVSAGGVSVTGSFAVSDNFTVGSNFTVTGNIDGTGTNILWSSFLDLTDGIETSITLRKALRAMGAALAGELSGAATTSVTIKALGNNGTTRLAATVDSSGNRIAVTPTL